MQKVYFIILVILVFGCTGVSTQKINAQETNNTIPPKEQPRNKENQIHMESVLVATVNIYEAEITRKDENNFNISFVLSNREKSQPDVRYGIKLYSTQEDGNREMVDEKIYPESINLGENSEISRNISYDPPSYLEGNYEVELIAQNKEGLSLGLSHLGEIKLKGTGRYVEILENTCFLCVDGEEGRKFDLFQGIDVKKEEDLKLNCEIKNYTQKQITLYPAIKTYYRSIFGKEVKVKQDFPSGINLRESEQKNISVDIPKPNNPQAYSAKVSFESNPTVPVDFVPVHYVVKGKSATVQNLLLDKNYYQKGEVAEVEFFYSGSADNFMNSRLPSDEAKEVLADIKIINQNNDICGEKEMDEIKSSEMQKNVNIKITRNCIDPSVEVVIKDEKTGEILGSSVFDFESDKESTKHVVNNNTSAEKENEKETKEGVISLESFGFIGGVLVLLLGLGYLFYKRRKNTILMLLMITGFFVFFSEAKDVGADTSWVRYDVRPGVGPEGWVPHDFLFNYNLDKRAYEPGETARGNARMSHVQCNNSVDFGKIVIRIPDGERGKSCSGSSRCYHRKRVPYREGNYVAVFDYNDLRYLYPKDEWKGNVYLNTKANHAGLSIPATKSALESAGYYWPYKDHYRDYGRYEPGVTGYLSRSDFSNNPNRRFTIDFRVSCASHDERRCYNGDVYWYDSCGKKENKAENCSSDYCDSWGPWTCQDGDTKIRERTCYHQGCSSGSCYKTPYTETETQDCVKDGVVQDDLPGKCIQGQCVYSGQCGSAAGGDPICEKPENNLCFIDFFEDPTVKYDEAGEDKSQDKFYWTCDGYDPDSTADDKTGNNRCEIDRDCQVVPGNWVEE